MAKLVFNYGTMNASKSMNLLASVHNYEQLGRKVALIKPTTDTRDELIQSRTGLKHDCLTISKQESVFEILNKKILEEIECLFVDEVQFFTPQQVRELSMLVDNYNIPVLCYGLKNNYFGELFEGSKALLELADEFREIRTICEHCKRKATHNILFLNGNVVKNELPTGETFIGDSEYKSVCRKHYYEILRKGESEK